MPIGYGEAAPYGQCAYKGECSGTGFMQNKISVCLRYAVKPDQGTGWSQYGGDKWIWHEPTVKPERVLLSNDLVKTIAFDESSGKTYEISTYQGPDGSSISRAWQDKMGIGYAGTPIPWEIRLKEHRGAEEHMKIEHIQSNLYLRPWNEKTRSTSGHDANGFRSILAIISKIFKDGALVASAESKDIPQTGNVAYDIKAEGHRLQPGYEGNASELKIVRTNHKYLQRDTAGDPSERIMSEQNWQSEFTQPLLWLSRGLQLERNRATGVLCGGSIFGSILGPDGKTNSAMVFSPSNGLTTTITNLTNDFTIMFGVSAVMGTATVIALQTGLLGASVVEIGDEYFAVFIDGVNTYQQLLNWKGTGWTLLQFIRSDNNLIIRENGETLNTFALLNMGTYGGAVDIMSADTGNVFDLRVYASVISEKAFGYYYENVIKHGGNSICPIW